MEHVKRRTRESEEEEVQTFWYVMLARDTTECVMETCHETRCTQFGKRNEKSSNVESGRALFPQQWRAETLEDPGGDGKTTSTTSSRMKKLKNPEDVT